MTDPVEEWFASAGPREEQLRRVDTLVREAAPDLDRQLVPAGGGQVLGYGPMPYRPRSARETTLWPLAALAARLGRVSCGRSCIRFSSLERIDTGELAVLVRDAAAVTASGGTAYSAG